MELYIHIPFCVEKCGYCDFLSFPAGREIRERYLDALFLELRVRGAGSDPVSSVFIGGGTPSLLSEEAIGTLMETVRMNFRLLPDAEVSIEANPGTVTCDKLTAMRNAGINRISFGAQSFHDAELRALGRIHRSAGIWESFEAARDAGFENINLDLMSALPGQTLSGWEENLRSAIRLGPEHISAYSLIIEEGTPFYERQDFLELPDEDTERRMYERTAEILENAGYRQYEISNYAKPGSACRHNTGYWTGVPYLGAGLGAASLLADGNQTFRCRNTDRLDTYLSLAGQGDPAAFAEGIRRDLEPLSVSDRMAEYMILGLRMNRGVSGREFRGRFGVPMPERYQDIIEKYKAGGLLQEQNGRVSLTARGRSLSNQVMCEFL